MDTRSLHLSLLLFALAGSACSSRNSPEHAVQRALEATVQHNVTALNRVVDKDAHGEAMDLMALHFKAVQLASLADGEVHAQIQHLTYRALRHEVDHADVQVKGEARINAFGASLTLPLDVIVPIVRREGRWLVTR